MAHVRPETVPDEALIADRAVPPRSQSEMGDVVYVELPEVGAQIKKDETFGVVESVKVCAAIQLW